MFHFEGFFRLPPLPPHFRLAQLAFHCGTEPLQLVLHHIIVRAGFHRCHRGILGYVS